MGTEVNIKLGILDDCKTDLLQLENILYKAAELCNVEIDIRFICRDWEDFIKNYKSISVDACILDIEINDKDVTGMDIAKAIDNENSSTRIIFLTGHTEYMKKSFSVSAFDFLIKPIKLTDVVSTLNRLVTKISVHGRCLEIKAHEYIRIPYQDILIIKYENRHVNIITQKTVEILPSTYTLAQVMDLLPKEFIECNSNLCINMQYVRKIDGQKILMGSRINEEVYASKAGIKRVREYIERG